MTRRVEYLPFVDEHCLGIAASPAVVWVALDRYVVSSLDLSRGILLRRLLGTEPPAGFEVAERVVGERLTLTGRHRFSRYRLEFVLRDADDGTTELRALTYAVFPGPHGWVYRAVVIGSGAHVVATTRVLRSIRRLSLEVGAGTPG